MNELHHHSSKRPVLGYRVTEVYPVITTSMAPWCPNTSFLRTVIEGMRAILGYRAIIHIYCDGAHPKANDTDYRCYTKYKELIGHQYGVVLHESHEWVGLVGLYRMIIHDLRLPLVFSVQHDWEFLSTERIDTNNLCHTLLDYPEVQIVRFHKRSLPQANHHVDRVYHEVDNYPVPLIATDGWGDSPHFARADHYRNLVLPNLADDCGDDGRYGIEGPVWRAYRRDIKRAGFDSAHRKWGSFLYGKFNQGAYVQHLGGSATKWRKQRDMQKVK